MKSSRIETRPPRHVPAPLQFKLRTLLLMMTVLSALFAALSSLGTVGNVIVFWGLLLVGAHVFANAYGTKVRSRPMSADVMDEGPAVWLRSGPSGQSATGDRTARPPSQRLTPRSDALERHKSYHQRSRLRDTSISTRRMMASTAIAAAFGGLFGAVTLTNVYWDHAGVIAIAFGALSAAVLGGFVGFLLSTWWEVMSTAWADAVAEYDGSKADSSRR